MPLVLPAPGVKVAPAGSPVALSEAIASPSGSAAVTSTVSGAFSAPDAVAGTVTTGGRSFSVTVIVVVAEPESALLAVKVTTYVPASLKPGVQLSVPLVLPAPGVKVAPAGSPVALSEAIASPSGSAAVTSTVSGAPSAPETVAGAVTTGARSVSPIVISVLEAPESALAAVKVTV